MPAWEGSEGTASGNVTYLCPGGRASLRRVSQHHHGGQKNLTEIMQITKQRVESIQSEMSLHFQCIALDLWTKTLLDEIAEVKSNVKILTSF